MDEEMISMGRWQGLGTVRPSTMMKAFIYSIVAVTLGLLADFVVNVATGGSLPGPLDGLRGLAWPALILVFLSSLGAAVHGQLQHRTAGTFDVDAATGPSALQSVLPRTIDEFTGREQKLEERHTLVPPPESRRQAVPLLVNIYGPAGAGKSTLAIRFAHEIAPRYPDAQLYVDLHGVSANPLTPVEGLRRLMRMLGVRGRDLPTELEGLEARYRQHLTGKRAIVVLDHAANESQVRPLLPGLPTAVVLITSQQPLDELIGTRQVRLGVMSDAEAIALLERVARGRFWGTGHIDAARQVAELCGNLPLALSIAGVLMRRHGSRPLTALISRLKDERDLLAQFQLGDLDVRVGFDVGYDHLTARERTLFRRLPLLPERTFGTDMAAALLGSQRDEAEQVLQRLVAEQMLEQVGDDRYALQSLIAVYAEEKLHEEEPLRERQRSLVQALRLCMEETMNQSALLDPVILEADDSMACRPAVSLDRQLAALDWFERERANLVTVLARAAEIEAHDITWRLAASLLPFFDLRGHRDAWSEMQEAALRSARACGGIQAQAWIELTCGYLQWLQRMHRQACWHLEEALEMAMAGRWPRLEARARYLLGRVALDREQFEEALTRFNHAANIFHDERLNQDQMDTMVDIAITLHEQEKLSGPDVLQLGRAVLDVLASMPEELWAVRSIGRIKDYLGHVVEELGDFEQAGMYYIGSGEAFKRIGFRHGHAHAMRDLGRVRMKQGSLARAAAFLDESARIFRTIGDHYDEGLTLLLAGDTQDRLGDRPSARLLWERGLRALTEAGAEEVAEARSRLDRTVHVVGAP